jgi:hypothetical protein
MNIQAELYQAFEGEISRSLFRYDCFFVVLAFFHPLLAFLAWLMLGYNSAEVAAFLLSVDFKKRKNIELRNVDFNEPGLNHLLNFASAPGPGNNCLSSVKDALQGDVYDILTPDVLLGDLHLLQDLCPTQSIRYRISEVERDFIDLLELQQDACDTLNCLSDAEFRVSPGNYTTLLLFPSKGQAKPFDNEIYSLFSGAFHFKLSSQRSMLHSRNYRQAKRPCGCGSCKKICDLVYQKGEVDHVFIVPSFVEYTGSFSQVIRVTLEECSQPIRFQPWIRYLFPQYKFEDQYLPFILALGKGMFKFPQRYVFRAEAHSGKLEEIVTLVWERQGHTKNKDYIRHAITSILEEKFSYPADMKGCTKRSYKRLYCICLDLLEGMYSTKSRTKMGFLIKRRYYKSVSLIENVLKPLPMHDFQLEVGSPKVSQSSSIYYKIDGEVADASAAEEALEVGRKFNEKVEELSSKYNISARTASSIASDLVDVKRNVMSYTDIRHTMLPQFTVFWVPKKNPSYQKRSKTHVRGKTTTKKQRKAMKKSKPQEINSDTPLEVLYDLYTTMERAKRFSKGFHLHKITKMLSKEDFIRAMQGKLSYTSNSLEVVKKLSGRPCIGFRHSVINRIVAKKLKNPVKKSFHNEVRVESVQIKCRTSAMSEVITQVANRVKRRTVTKVLKDTFEGYIASGDKLENINAAIDGEGLRDYYLSLI